jgi:putative tryptophan/tyrosine transport system substrate-binding protein
MQRRAFITLFAGAAVARPLAARAQQTERMRRIGVLMGVAADDPEGQARVTLFVQALQQLGWTDGRNMRIEVRWGAVDADRYRKYAEELVALAPDVILAGSSAALAPLQRATRTVPIVFAGVADPVGAGYVDSLARPGGNVTGFALFDWYRRKVAGASQANCAGGNASGSHAGPNHIARYWSVGRDPGHGTIDGG